MTIFCHLVRLFLEFKYSVNFRLPPFKSNPIRMSRGGDYREDRRGGGGGGGGGGDGGYRRPPRDIDTMTSLRVGNLPFQTQHDVS